MVRVRILVNHLIAQRRHCVRIDRTALLIGCLLGEGEVVFDGGEAGVVCGRDD